MKISVIFLLVFLLNVNASIYSQNFKFDLTADNQPLRDVLKEIENKSDFRFFFSENLLLLDKTVQINIKQSSVEQILDKLLASTGYYYKVLDNNLIIIAPSKFILRQEITITGNVSDEDGQPLPGVTILEKGTANGTIADSKGNYSIVVNSGATLVFSFVGMETQEITVADKITIDVILKASVFGLEEVVAVGYGTQSRSTLTTSISKLDSKVLANVPFTNAASALQGNVSGVLVQSTSGQPGDAPRIIIRGGTSINSPNDAAPLYVIDGVIRSDMNNINSEDIESIQVLKDAASTTIYGARGSNGVVLITTKSGKSGQAQFSYNYDLTFSNVGKTYDMASARDYIYYARIGCVVTSRKIPNSILALTQPTGWGTGNDLTKNTGYTTQYLTPENEYKLDEGWESLPDPVDPSKTIIFKGTDWQDVLFRTGIAHNHHVSVNGGTDKATFSAGIGYMTNEGVVITTKYDRISLNLNGTIKVRDNLSFYGRTIYSNSNDNSVYNLTHNLMRTPGLAPTAKYTFEDGTLAPGVGKKAGNPEYFLNREKNENNIENITLSLGGHWEILPGLSFDPQVSLFKIAGEENYFMPSYLNGANKWVTTREASSDYSKTIQTQADAIFSYKNTFAYLHNIEATAGLSYFGKEFFNLSASGQGAATDLIPRLNAISTMVDMNSSTSQQVILGYFGRINYDFKRKYLVSLNARYDGASNLGASNKWGFFPGISVGWNLHEEDFWNIFPEKLIRMKLRGSYGVTGNISGLSDFQAQGSYSVGYKYMGASAIENTIIANHDLRWEHSKTLDVGADIGILNRRIEIIVDCYRRVTDDLLTTLSLPPSTGFTSIFTNLGSLENKGFEIELGARLLPAESNLQWKVTFIGSKTKHKILKLPYNGTENNRVGGFYVWNPEIGDYNWVGGLQEGGRIGDYYAWKQLSIYSTDEEALSAPIDMIMSYTDKTKYGGDVNYLDADQNDTLDLRDLVYMGNPYPKWTGGISSSVSYKGFDLYLRMDYMTGHLIYNHAKIFLAGDWASNLNFPQEMVTDGWKQQGDIATRTQYIDGVGNYNYWRGAYHTTSSNSEFYESGNFLCIREITLSYNFHSEILKKMKINDLRFNLTGNNLHYFTKYTGMSPEEGGNDDGRYPLPRNIILGVNVSF